MLVEVECPYCFMEVYIPAPEIEHMEEHENYKYTCRSCKKKFTYQIQLIMKSDAYPAHCLNDGEHDFKMGNNGRCIHCGEENERK